MTYQSAPRWFLGHLENDRVLRTNRAHRWRRVSQNRSTWAVRPESLPTARYWAAGRATWYAARTSVSTVDPVRYAFGTASRSRRAVPDGHREGASGCARRGPPRPSGCRPSSRRGSRARRPRSRPERPFWGRPGVVWGALPVQGVDEPLDPRPGSAGDPGDRPEADPLGQEATDQGRVGLPDRTLLGGGHEPPAAAPRAERRGARGVDPVPDHVGRRTPGAWRGGARVRGRFAHPGKVERCHRSSHYPSHSSTNSGH